MKRPRVSYDSDDSEATDVEPSTIEGWYTDLEALLASSTFAPVALGDTAAYQESLSTYACALIGVPPEDPRVCVTKVCMGNRYIDTFERIPRAAQMELTQGQFGNLQTWFRNQPTGDTRMWFKGFGAAQPSPVDKSVLEYYRDGSTGATFAWNPLAAKGPLDVWELFPELATMVETKENADKLYVASDGCKIMPGTKMTKIHTDNSEGTQRVQVCLLLDGPTAKYHLFITPLCTEARELVGLIMGCDGPPKPGFAPTKIPRLATLLKKYGQTVHGFMCFAEGTPHWEARVGNTNDVFRCYLGYQVIDKEPLEARIRVAYLRLHGYAMNVYSNRKNTLHQNEKTNQYWKFSVMERDQRLEGYLGTSTADMRTWLVENASPLQLKLLSLSSLLVAPAPL